MSENKKRAVIILSGGLDSTTCMGLAQEAGYDLFPISFDYGQRHKIEIENAKQVAEHYGVSARHKIIKLDFLRDFGGSALTDDTIDVPNVMNGSELGRNPSNLCARTQSIISLDCYVLCRSNRLSSYLHRCECARLQRISGLPSGIYS